MRPRGADDDDLWCLTIPARRCEHVAIESDFFRQLRIVRPLYPEIDRLGAMKASVVGLVTLACLATATAAEPAFEKNIGQSRSRAEFLLRVPGAHLLLNRDSLEFRLAGGETHCWRWEGASSGDWEGIEATGDSFVYYLGSNPELRNYPAPAYRRLIRRNLYPNIDQVAYIRDGKFEYDLILRPGADPDVIRLRAPGASADSAGALRTRAAAGSLLQTAPRTFERIAGVERPVDARFVPDPDGLFRLQAGPYRRDATLVVDPAVSAVLAVFGSGDDRVIASSDNITVGVTRSADWNRAPGGGQ